MSTDEDRETAAYHKHREFLETISQQLYQKALADPKVGTGQNSQLNFRSKNRIQILAILLVNRDAADSEVCEQLDRDGAELSGKARMTDMSKNTFVCAYRDRTRRNLIERQISAVRRAMRKAGIPVP